MSTILKNIKELKKKPEFKNIGAIWTLHEDEKLVNEINDNKTYEEIALEHKRHIDDIIERVISRIIYPKHKDNMDIIKITTEYNINTEQLKKHISILETTDFIEKSIENNMNLKKTITKWNIYEDEKLVQEINDNKTYEEIAIEHRRTTSAIKSRVISQIIYPKYKDNMDIEKIAIEYNINSKLLKKHLKSKKTDNNKIMEYLLFIDNKINEMDCKMDKIINSLQI